MGYPSDEAIVFAATTKQQVQMIERLQWQNAQLENRVREAESSLRFRESVLSVLVSIVLLPAFLLRAVAASSSRHQIRRLQRACRIKNNTIRQMHCRLKQHTITKQGEHV